MCIICFIMLSNVSFHSHLTLFYVFPTCNVTPCLFRNKLSLYLVYFYLSFYLLTLLFCKNQLIRWPAKQILILILKLFHWIAFSFEWGLLKEQVIYICKHWTEIVFESYFSLIYIENVICFNLWTRKREYI